MTRTEAIPNNEDLSTSRSSTLRGEGAKTVAVDPHDRMTVNLNFDSE